MLPGYGMNIGKSLYENAGDASKAIKESIYEAVASWLPGIQATDIQVIDNSFADGQLIIDVTISLPNGDTTTVKLNSYTIDEYGNATRSTR